MTIIFNEFLRLAAKEVKNENLAKEESHVNIEVVNGPQQGGSSCNSYSI